MTTFTDHELATVLAGLRLWDAMNSEAPDAVLDIGTDGGRFPPMLGDDIEDLCERLNCEKPPLSIDVSPVKRSGDGWTVTDDAHAVGYGVYIRNPLAHHVADFLLPGWQAASPERLAEAKRAAFAYADHLAAHLGCAVDGGERPADPVPVGDLLHGAACLWEEALNLQGRNADPKGGAMPYAPHAVAEFLREWDGNGSVHMRVMVTSWAEECERDWKSAHDAGKFDAPYDWEWCPRWLAQRLEAVYPAPAAPAPVDGRRMVPGDLFTAPFSPAHILFAYPADGGAN